MKFRQFLNEEWYRPKTNATVGDIAKRYYEQGDKAHEYLKTKAGHAFTVVATVKELDKYKEYDWSRTKFRKMDIEPEYWDKLVKEIKKDGIRNPLTIILYKHEPKRAKIGEGNHRLGIAKEIGLKDLPVRFEYWMGNEPKKKDKSDREFDKILKDFEKEREERQINKLLKQILGEI
jgi:hypothetical protein